MRIIALFALLTLAACGANGAPETPQAGMTMTATAEAGVAQDGSN